MLSAFNHNNFYNILNSYSTAQLEQMVKQYPFQHELHLLLAKKYQLEKNAAFDEQLQVAAIYAQDRELFFTLFNEAVPGLSEVKSELYETNTTSEAVAVQNELLSETNKIESAEEPIPQNLETPEVGQQETNEPETLIQENKQIEESKRTFDEWLRLFQPQGSMAVEPEEDKPENILAPADDELNRLILENTPVDFLHELVKEETHYSKGLDEFIQQQKHRKRQPEAKKQSAENEIDPDMVTETLAGLYETQKKYSRAIKAYQALSLKYPEKSDLFAARINYLKNLS